MITSNRFNTIDSMWTNALADLFDRGRPSDSRIGNTLEIIGWSGVLTDLEYTFLCNPRRKLSASYAAAELIWYLSGEANINRIRFYAPQYEQYAEGNIAYGAYGERLKNNIRNCDQMRLAIKMLNTSPASRQCVLSMWRPDDMLMAYEQKHKDLPCTLNWQFFMREGELHMVTNMRSQDVWLGMPYDIFVNTCMMRLLANDLQVKMGTYTHNCGSLHIYEKNWEAAREARCIHPVSLPNYWEKGDDSVYDSSRVCEIEEKMRLLGNLQPHQDVHFTDMGVMLQDLLRACALKFGYVSDMFTSAALLQAAQRC